MREDIIVDWRKSTYSSGGDCLEACGSVQVRDSQDRDGPVLEFTPAAWREFTAGIKRA